MIGRQKSVQKAVSVMIVACFFFSFLAGLSAPALGAAVNQNEVLAAGDLYIGAGDYFLIDGYDHQIRGNVTVDGGILEIRGGGSLSFLQDVDNHFSLIVQNGGILLMDNATVTVYLDQIHTYPYLVMAVSAGSVTMLNSSSLRFPGWLNVTNSYFNMTGSAITSIDDALIDAFVGDHVNTAEGDNANDCPVTLFTDSTVFMYDSRVENIFEYTRGDGNFHTDNFNITLAGTTSLTVVNTYIGVDFSNANDSFSSVNNAHIKNFMVIRNDSAAYLYAPSVDESQTPSAGDRDSIFYITDTAQAYIFRWANYTVLDANSLVVPGAAIEAMEVSNGWDAPVYPSTYGNLSIPPVEVLTYLGKNASNFNITDDRGEATIPYLTDIFQPGSYNSEFIGNYRANASYTDTTLHEGNASFSFDPYPVVTPESMVVNVSIVMSDLVMPKPELFVSALVTAPTLVYEGDTAILTAVVNNSGGSNAVDVNVSFYDGGEYINSTIISLIMAGGSENASVVWNSTFTYAGAHVINVTVDPVDPLHPDGLVLEEDETNNTYLQQITVIERMPDLSISAVDITTTPASPYAGNDFVVSAVIHNDGDVDAERVAVAFYNGTPDSNGDLLVDITADELGVVYADVPASSQATVNITISFDLPGIYDIYVWVDPYNETAEYSDTNNLAYISVSVLPKPNLMIEPADISFSDLYPDEGQSVNIQAIIHNVGALAVSDSFDVYFFLDTNSSDALIAIYSYDPAVSGNITPGGSITATALWVASPNGPHSIIVVVDYNNTVDESTESDNSAEAGLTVMRTGDLDLIVNDTHYSSLVIDFSYSLAGYVLVEEHGVLTISDSTFKVVQDNSNQYWIVVRDDGELHIDSSTLTSNYMLTVYLYGNATLVISDSSITSYVVVEAHDTSYVEIEGSALGNSISFPDPDSRVTMSAMNTTFNQALNSVMGSTALSLTNVYTPYISLSDSSTASIYRWLSVYTYDGTGHALSNVTVNTYFPVNGTHWRSAVSDDNGMALLSLLTDVLYGDSDRELFSSYMVNASYVFQNTTYFSTDSYVSMDNYPIMQNLAPHQYTSMSITFDALRPDLDPPVYVSNPAPVLGVDSIYINTTVWNNGTATAYDIDVRFYDGLTSIGDVYIPELGVGESVNCSITWTADYPVGEHNMSVVIDPNNEIAELDETNNVGWTIIDVIGWPDLTLEEGDISFITQGAMRGGVIQVSAAIHNIGDSISETTHVAFYDGNPESGGVQFAITDVDPIDIGGTATVVVDWIPDSAGWHYIYVIIDPYDTLNETNEENNFAFNSIDVKDYPDLEITAMLFQYDADLYGDVDAGDNVSIPVTVYNGGASPAANVVVELWIGEIGTGTPVGDSQSIPTLASKASQIVTFHWTAPDVLTDITETYTFTAVVDRYNQIPETNDLNNEYSSTLVVRDARPDITFAGDVSLNYTTENNLTGGDLVNISALVLNTGVSDATVDFSVFATLSNGTEYLLTNITSVNVMAVNQTEIYYEWTVDLPAETYFISIRADPLDLISETDEENNLADNASLTVHEPVPSFGLYPSLDHPDAAYTAGNAVIITGTVINNLNVAPLGGVQVTARLVDAEGTPMTYPDGTPVTISGNTGTDGTYSLILRLPENLNTGDYYIEVSLDDTTNTATLYLGVEGIATGFSFLYIAIIAIAALVALVSPVIYLKFFGKLGEMVECGACGALIPAGSGKCPKCGVEFEMETAKCSVCSAWIPVDASVCPECGAVFAPETEEEEYERKMREEYDAEVLTPLREKAKEELGEEFDDEKFMEWAEKQPGFITFEAWLDKREAEREKMVECPVCATLNPPDAVICQACGSEITPPEGKKPKKAKKKPVKKMKAPPEEETPLEPEAPVKVQREAKPEKKEEAPVKLGLEDVLGPSGIPAEKPVRKPAPEGPAPRKVLTPAPSERPPERKPVPEGMGAPKKVVRKPVQKRVVKKPIERPSPEEKKE